MVKSQVRTKNRRSARVVASIPVRLTAGQDPPSDGLTAVLNRHGALVLSPIQHEEGAILTIRNELNSKATRCRVIWVGMADRSGLYKLGIEFVDDVPTFWGHLYQDRSTLLTT